MDLPEVTEIRQCPDAQQQIRLLARFSRTILERTAPAHRILAHRRPGRTLQPPPRRPRTRNVAAPPSPRSSSCSWQTRRCETTCHQRRRSTPTGSLANPSTFALLTEQRGWSPDDYERWLGDGLGRPAARRLSPRTTEKRPKVVRGPWETQQPPSRTSTATNRRAPFATTLCWKRASMSAEGRTSASYGRSGPLKRPHIQPAWPSVIDATTASHAQEVHAIAGCRPVSNGLPSTCSRKAIASSFRHRGEWPRCEEAGPGRWQRWTLGKIGRIEAADAVAMLSRTEFEAAIEVARCSSPCRQLDHLCKRRGRLRDPQWCDRRRERSADCPTTCR